MSKLSSAFKKLTGISLTGGAIAAGGAFIGAPTVIAAGVSTGLAQAASPQPAPQPVGSYQAVTEAPGQTNVAPLAQFSQPSPTESRASASSFGGASSSTLLLIGAALLALFLFVRLKGK